MEAQGRFRMYVGIGIIMSGVPGFLALTTRIYIASVGFDTFRSNLTLMRKLV